MKKKVLAALLCAAMVGTTLAGCGSSGSDSGSDNSAKQTGKKEMDVWVQKLLEQTDEENVVRMLKQVVPTYTPNRIKD